MCRPPAICAASSCTTRLTKRKSAGFGWVVTVCSLNAADLHMVRMSCGTDRGHRSTRHSYVQNSPRDVASVRMACAVTSFMPIPCCRQYFMSVVRARLRVAAPRQTSRGSSVVNAREDFSAQSSWCARSCRVLGPWLSYHTVFAFAHAACACRLADLLALEATRIAARCTHSTSL